MDFSIAKAAGLSDEEVGEIIGVSRVMAWKYRKGLAEPRAYGGVDLRDRAATLVKILDALGVKPFGEAGETFDPQRHNAVMHIEDESLGENVIAEVFQTGFAHGDKVIRFAMVKVAN